MSVSQTERKRIDFRIGRSVSLDHAAELLGVSRRTIYNRIREGRLQTVPTLGSSKRVLLQSVIDVSRHGVRRGGSHGHSDTKGEAQMEVKTQIKAGDGDDTIFWGN